MPTHLGLAALLALLAPAALAQADEPAESGTEDVKYGAEFLASGVGARALGMGGAYVAHAADVTAGYWNPAGLARAAYAEGAYMHAERFGGAVVFDYAAVAYPITDRSTVAVSFVRSAVDDIANTLDAFDPATGLPRPDATDRVTYFSAADNALFLSYARAVGDRLTLGASAKVIRRGIGDFASTWGYSLDVGAQARLGGVLLGLAVQDPARMVQSWSVDEAAFQALDGEARPVGLTERVDPVVRLGAAGTRALSPAVGLTVAADLDLLFDGRRANALDAGGVSFHPRAGAEVTYRGALALRAGVSDVFQNEDYGTQLTPSVGAGVRLGRLAVDYGFGDFGGLSSELGYSHRVSLAYRFRHLVGTE
jgi:hypothetical protein